VILAEKQSSDGITFSSSSNGPLTELPNWPIYAGSKMPSISKGSYHFCTSSKTLKSLKMWQKYTY